MSAPTATGEGGPKVRPLFPSQQREAAAERPPVPPVVTARRAAAEARATASAAVDAFTGLLARTIEEAQALADLETAPNGVREICRLMAGNLSVDARSIAAIRQRVTTP